MTADREWLERASWSRRSSEFGAVTTWDGFVNVEFAMPGASSVVVPERLWELWLGLPEHPNVLKAAGVNLLRYAALDWTHQPVAIDGDPANAARFATWGIVLARVYEFLLTCVPAHDLAWLTCPIVTFDLEGVVRVGFVGAGGNRTLTEATPPEILDRWPWCDERALVFVVGHALKRLAIPTKVLTPVGQVVQRCIERDPARRYARLDEVSAALRGVGGRIVLRAGLSPARTEWNLLERGLGLLAVNELNGAFEWFAKARRQFPGSGRARALCDEARARGARSLFADDAPPPERDGRGRARPTVVQAAAPPPEGPAWAEVELVGRALEDERNFDAAVALYRTARVDDGEVIASATAIARCQLERGELRDAIEHTQRVLKRDPEHREALAICVTALLRNARYAEALEVADSWLVVAPNDGRVFNARAKCLLGLGRLLEARDAFDRACTLSPQLLDAMLLRREVDRSLKGVRASAGIAAPMSVDLPDHLAELRDVLVSGRVEDGIAMLQRSGYAQDAVAQVLLGELMSYDGRFTDALPVFDQATHLGADHRHAALLGKARALLGLERWEDALALFERVREERPDLAEASEGCGRALERLGRADEAEEAFARYVSLGTRGSSLRVRG